MKDLIVCDFEHTLINNEEEIPTSTVILIDELRRNNKKFIVMTEGPLKRILYYNHDFTFIDYIILAGGAIVYDTIREKTIYKKNILLSNIKKIIDNFLLTSSIYLVDNLNYNLISKENYIEDNDVEIITDYSLYLENNKNNIYKIELYFNNKNNYEEAIKKINCLGLNVNILVRKKNELFVIDIVHKDVSNLNALEKVVSKCKKTLDDVIYIGTDSEIIGNVEVGVTTENEVPYLKKLAGNVTDDCNHKGVEKFLKNYYESVMR